MICGATLGAMVLVCAMVVVFLFAEYRRWKALTW